MLNNAGITIKDALQLEELKNAKLIAGKNGIGNVITQINIMEVPDIGNWIKKGELLLTTAFSIKDDPIAQKELIPKLHEKGLAGLAIKPKRYLNNISDEMIKQADELNFPLIELPYEASFSDIMSPILANVLNKQAAMLKKLEDVHKGLMDILLEGGGLEDIGFALSKLLKNPVVIQDMLFNKSVIAPYKEDGKLEEELKLKADQQSKAAPRYYQLHRHQKTEDQINEKNVTKLTMPIIVGNKIYGYIITWEMYTSLEAIDIRTIETSSAIVALQITQNLSVMEVERRHKTEFIEDLLSLDEKLQKSAIERGNIFGLEFDKNYLVLVINLDNFEKSYEKTPNNQEFIQQYRNKIQHDIQKVANELQHSVIMGDKSENIIVLLAVEPLSDPKHIKEKSMTLGNKIKESLKNKFQDIHFIIGIGRYYSNIEELHKSYEDAKKSISLGRLFDQDEVIHFDDLGIYRLFYYDNMQPELIRFYKETLLPLVKYDRARDTELVITLQAYFQNNGNLKKISKQLFTHYNTILYRIQRIEEICNTSLQDPQGRLNLEIALKIMHIINENQVEDVK